MLDREPVPKFQCILHSTTRAKRHPICYSATMHSSPLQRRNQPLVSGVLMLAASLAVTRGVLAADLDSPPRSTLVTNVLQLRSLATQEPEVSFEFQLEGDVWWANGSRFVLHDASGTEILETDPSGPAIKTGDRIQLGGHGSIVPRGAGLQLGARGPIVDNDGIHTMLGVSGSIYLAAGRQPFRLSWFNGTGRFGLRVEYEGPGLPRQKIPETALWHNEPGPDGALRLAQGLSYRCFEGVWNRLPDFRQLSPVKSGTNQKLDLTSRTRDNHVALEFTGLIDIPRDGTYRFYVQSDDGSQLFVGEPTLTSRAIGTANFPSPHPIAVGQRLSENETDLGWAQTEGKVASVRTPSADESVYAARPGLAFELRTGAASMQVQVADASGLSAEELLNHRLRVSGFCQRNFNLDGEIVAGLLLVPGKDQIQRIDSVGPVPSPGAPSLLTFARAVRELRPEDVKCGLPLRIRGVVTCVQPDRQGFVLQDSTQGLYVSASNRPIELPKVRDFLEVEGNTAEPGIAKLTRLTRLGQGTLPEPSQPTWDQLMNGSQDSQWIEIRGLVEGLIDRSNGWTRMMLRSRAGLLKADLRQAGVRPSPLEQYQDAVVRLRGCMFADYMPDWRLKVGQIKMYDVDVLVDQPAPTDVFSLPLMSVAALKRFDPSFDVSHRVKVAGQVVYVRGADYFLMDGKDGLRFLARQPLGFEAGDTVEAVGFPELSGAAPVLRAAVARKTGHAELPLPKKLAPDDLVLSVLDSTLVQIDGHLTGIRQTRTNLVLDMQSGSWRYLARLNTGEAARQLRVGSRLRLTGVYCAQGGYQALGTDVAAVDLLLSHAADILVLAQPPWWTLPRLLVAVGILAVALAITVLWITQLRRQVEDRTAELAVQIQSRQQLEQKRALDQERTRIAQDLHDELGSDIATISMLAARAKFTTAPEEKRSEYLDQVRGKAREMVAALDEIVWAMNPGHDSLTSVVDYLGRYADRFLGLANIAVRLDTPGAPADVPMDSRLRHQVFLAFREALTNVVQHSGATEVQLAIQSERDELRVAVADNGRGLPAGQRAEDMNGLANMRDRIERLHGNFEINGDPDRGTTVRFNVPLNGTTHETL